MTQPLIAGSRLKGPRTGTSAAARTLARGRKLGATGQVAGDWTGLLGGPLHKLLLRTMADPQM